jgi:HK97 family phage portal protein
MAPNIFSRILEPFRFKQTPVEGGFREGPYFLPVSGGWLPAGVPANWWQTGFTIQGMPTSAIVEACVSAYSQTVAMCPGTHWRSTDNGGRERVDTSALSRILSTPNAYQTISDFKLNAVRSLYLDGNAYALALRNSRFEIQELHLMYPRSCAAVIAETGEIFYSLGGNQVIDSQLGLDRYMVPARDVMHIRLHTSRNTLLGESPIVAASGDIAAAGAITQQQFAFYQNQARPSSVLQTEMVLDKDQVNQLRDRWNEQTRGLQAGGTPILTAGLKLQPVGVPPADAQLADVMKFTEQHIALAFRIPLQILGIGGAPVGSTEALMQSWIASGLGFCLNHVEEAFDKTFDLWGEPHEYCEFDTGVLLRSDLKNRIEALARGVQGGIFSPNEARAEENLKAVPYGDSPRVQQQVVPLEAAAGIPSAPAAPGAPAAPATPALPKPRKRYDTEQWGRELLRSADRIDRLSA